MIIFIRDCKNKNWPFLFFCLFGRNPKNMQLFQPQMHICERFERVGIWDAIDSSNQPVNGPIVRCKDCGKECHLTWEKWESRILQGRANLEQASPA